MSESRKGKGILDFGGGAVPRSSPLVITVCLSDHAQSHVHTSVASMAGKESLPFSPSIRGGRKGEMANRSTTYSGARETELSKRDEVTVFMECLVAG